MNKEKINLVPLTKNQKELIAALRSPDLDIVGIFGPSGTGKSYISLLYGIESLMNNKYERIVLIRPVYELSTGRNYTITELHNTYNEIVLTYVRDIISDNKTYQLFKKFLDEEKISIVDPSLLIGRTFNRSFIFIDDTQFLPPVVITEALIRIGNESKLVIAGDPLFKPNNSTNSALLARELILGEERSMVIDLGTKDIVRPGAKIGFKLYLEMMLRQRKLNNVESHAKEVILSYSPDADIITVFATRDFKKDHNIKNSPDILIITKEEFLGRIIGKKGERIEKIQNELKMFVRATSLTNDLKNILIALHPLGWINKHIVDLDIIGPNLEVKVNISEIGAFIGQRGTYIRFLDKCLKKLLGIGIIVEGVERKEEKTKKRK
ncbi:MAG: PhoH family protein [Thermoproteales archaeon]|nr:PhoH family protein [Thermoproteales archaeon]